jgi:hypothetical protein
MKGMRLAAAGAMLLLVGLIRAPASAHRLDEYLQATLIGVSPRGTEIEIQLTPGVAMLPVLLAAIDQDGDGRISTEEERAYVGRVMREVELRVDGAGTPLTLVESRFPSIDSMREGLGTIVVKLRSARSGRVLRFENRHLPEVSVYLVNCLTDSADGLVVSRQDRDPAQKSIEVAYSFAGHGGVWTAVIGMVLVARLAVLLRRRS